MIFGAQPLVDELRGRAERAEARVQLLETEVRRLTDLLIELKRDGYAVVPEPIPPEPDPLDDQVVEVLQAAGVLESDPAWHQQARYVRRRLEEDSEIDRDELAEEIRTGDDPSLLLD